MSTLLASIPLVVSMLFPQPVIAVQQYSTPIIIEQVVLPAECSCVKGARKYSSFDIPRQNADQFMANSTPVKGGLVLLKYWNEENREWIYHVSVILYMFPGGVWVVEWNYKECQETERFISFEDPHVRGYWVSD